jgi:hypothetical protein
MKAPNLSQVEGLLLLGAAALVVYAAYKAYTTTAGAISGVAGKVQGAVQDAWKTASNFETNAQCGSCAAFPAICDFVNPTWMDQCIYAGRDPKTLSRSDATPDYIFNPSSPSADTSFPQNGQGSSIGLPSAPDDTSQLNYLM